MNAPAEKNHKKPLGTDSAQNSLELSSIEASLDRLISVQNHLSEQIQKHSTPAPSRQIQSVMDLLIKDTLIIASVLFWPTVIYWAFVA